LCDIERFGIHFVAVWCSGINTIKTNVLGTMNMLDLANRLKARFLISSTSEVYGDPKIVRVVSFGLARFARFVSVVGCGVSLICDVVVGLGDCGSAAPSGGRVLG
jgi:hypothetical protein